MKKEKILSKVLPVKVLFNFILIVSILNAISCSSDSDNLEDEIADPKDPQTIELDKSFYLDKDRKFTNLILSNQEYTNFIEGNGDIKMVSKKVYQYFKDDFDFIVILSVEETQPNSIYYGKSFKAKSDIEGIGSSLYNNTAAYGSGGNLKSIIHMPRTEYIVNGPFLHEIVHYWANHGFIPTTVGGHWGYSSVGGQLGGFNELTDLGNKTYQGKITGRSSFGGNANGGNSLPYANAELYLMGLIKASELEAIQVANNPQYAGSSGKFTADTIETHTAAELIAQHGNRVPSQQNSQKDFSIMTVIISKSAINDAKKADLNKDIENFSRKTAPDSYWGSSYNFWTATFEKASVSMDLSDNLK